MFINLTAKLISCFILVILLIVSATMGPTLYLFSETMQKNNEDRALEGMEGLGTIIEMHKQDALHYGSVFASNSMLVKAIEGKDVMQTLEILQSNIKHSNLDFATVTDDKGMVIARTHDPEGKGDDVTSQANIRGALLGEATVGIESKGKMKLAIRAGIPVKNSQGKIIGVVSVGCNLENNKIVDQAKRMFKTDATIFLGDVRLSTTIIKDHERIIGTKLNQKIDQRVLGEGQKYFGEAEILGENYVTAYMPLQDIDQKNVGVLFAGHKVEETIQARNKLIYTVTGVVLGAILIVIFLAILMAKRIVHPIKIVAKTARLVAAGDFNQHVEVASRDEVGTMANAFNYMVSQVQQLVGTLNLEIQERKHVEEVLRKSKEHYRLLADNATDVIWTMDLFGRFAYISPSVERLRGYTVEEALEQTISQWLTPSSAAIAIQKLKKVRDMVADGQHIGSQRIELEVRCKDHSLVWIETTCNGIYNAEGQLLGIQGVDRDITDERQLERSIHRDVELAGRLQKALLPKDKEHELFIIRTAYAPLREVSGDFYNYRFHPTGILRGYVSDITGHGIGAALNFAAVRLILDESLDNDLTLELVQEINTSLVDYISDEIFVALLMFEFDFNKKTVTMVTGGINHLLASTSKFNGVVTIAGGLMGLFEPADLSLVKESIQSGDIFYFMTDGLMDLIKQNVPDGVENFEKCFTVLQKQTQIASKKDDCSILCIKIK